MVAPRNSRHIHCQIIALPASSASNRLERSQRKPSELLPWADPYIALLVKRLQTEVRAERHRGQHRGRAPGSIATAAQAAPFRCEAEPPRSGTGLDFDANDLRFGVDDRRQSR